jgi:DNA-binding transcriptional LysR family regulator
MQGLVVPQSVRHYRKVWLGPVPATHRPPDRAGKPYALGVLPPATGFLRALITSAFRAQGLEEPRATVTKSSIYALAVLVANGPFLAIHPGTMLTSPNEHPHLTAVDVHLRTTRGSIGLITLKNRSLSSAAKAFLTCAADVVKTMRPVRLQRGRRQSS